MYTVDWIRMLALSSLEDRPIRARHGELCHIG